MKQIIKELGGPTKLAQQAGLSKSTLSKISAGTRMPGPNIRLLIGLLLVAKRKSIMGELLDASFEVLKKNK